MIFNNRIANPYDPNETVLKDSDELTFLSVFEGGRAGSFN